LHSPISEKKMT